MEQFILACSTEGVYGANAGDALKRIWFEAIAENTARTDPDISTFSRSSQDLRINQFIDADQRHIESGPQRVRRAWAERLVRVRDQFPDQSSTVAKQASLQRRHMPIRDLLSSAPDVMSAIKPCWVMSPLVVAELLPPRINFDVVIFDEASQIMPEDAILSILQANQTIVAGDPKQLPPTSFFTSSAGDDDEEDEELDEDLDEETKSALLQGQQAALTHDIESILDVVAVLLPLGRGRRNLTWHYRSQDERLIAFSNAQPELYNWGLTTFPGAGGYVPVTFEEVLWEAGYEGPTNSNENEVIRVVELILQHATERPNESLGVITLGLFHANKIDDALRLALTERPELEDFFSEDQSEPFFVKSIERVQGDEREAIILSVGYAKGDRGQIRYNFGAINQIGGERRLNVAVTRARKRVSAVCSYSGRDMDSTRLRREGPSLLKAYLEYADSGGSNLGERIVEKHPLNPFEKDVLSGLTDAGLALTTQHGASNYLIDYVAWHPENKGQPVLAIEADGASYHSSQSARDRDRLRQEHLERLGWRFHRIWSTEWFRNRDAEISKVLESFELALNGRLPPKTILPSSGSDDEVHEQHSQNRERSLPRPFIYAGEPIANYRHRDLVAILRWIESDDQLRTEQELLNEAILEMGYGRRGTRIVAALESAIRTLRG